MMRLLSRSFADYFLRDCARSLNTMLTTHNRPYHFLFTSLRSIGGSPIRLNMVVVKTPNFAESISVGDLRWEKSVGDLVNAGDLIGEIETDKASLSVNASVAGKITEFLVPDGSQVTPGVELAKIDTSVSPPEKLSSPQVSTPTVQSAVPQSPPTSTPSQPETQKAPSLTVSSPKISFVESGVSGGGESRVKLTRMRKRIGERLKGAQNTYAMLTTFNEVDMTNVIATRKRYLEMAQKDTNVRLGFLSAFVVASAHALKQMPVVNATIVGDDIIYRDYVDISIAVSSPKGLVVPVVRDVVGLNYIEVERKIADLSAKARDGSLSVEEMDGGTFTISNGGVFGSLMSTPILNPPQSAILGLHAIKDRPVAINGKVEIRPMMYLALTYDHRLIDGRESVTFLKSIKDAVEDPVRMLVGL